MTPICLLDVLHGISQCTLFLSYLSVSALEWDSSEQILYIGGRFDLIDEKKIPGGICMWTEATGLIPFEGTMTGLGLSPDLPNGEVISLVYEPKSQVSSCYSQK